MRALVAAFGLACLAACQRPVDVTGLYASQTDGSQPSAPALFFPCDGSGTGWLIRDSALAARYDTVASAPGEFVFAHLEGVPVDSGSIYGSQRYLRVQRILELRLRAPGDCPGVADTLPAPLRDSAGQPSADR